MSESEWGFSCPVLLKKLKNVRPRPHSRCNETKYIGGTLKLSKPRRTEILVEH